MGKAIFKKRDYAANVSLFKAAQIKLCSKGIELTKCL
jgi:hypothetical protein